LQRRARRRVPYPIIALVGYTNAGKSTLFNRLTGAEVYAEDQLFATLDPTMRRIETPSGQKVILSDTVGFISQLPHELVSAFQATLEEVIEADVIVHVRDAAHADREAQKSDVLAVLRQLGFSDTFEDTMIEVFNKADLLEPADKAALANLVTRSNTPVVLLSAATGDGCETLTAAIEKRITENYRTVEIALPHDDGASLAWLYDHGVVIERRDEDDAVHLKLRIDEADLARFEQRRAP